MPILNPSFEDAGTLPGEAAHWTLIAVTSLEEIAGFGTLPEQTWEDFERWFELRAVLEAVLTARAFFAPGTDGFESFSTGWGAGAYLFELPPAPMAKGGSIRGALQRGAGGGPTGFSPFLFLCCQGNSVNDSAYMLGLSDDDPHRVVLRKGAVAVGLPDADGAGVLLKSAASFAQGTWLHLRLDVIVNANGDVVLKVFQNDLSAHALGTTPDWQPVAGMVEFIDDHLGINSGSQPLTSDRGGFGFAVKNVTRRAYFDHLELLRQV